MSRVNDVFVIYVQYIQSSTILKHSCEWYNIQYPLELQQKESTVHMHIKKVHMTTEPMFQILK